LLFRDIPVSAVNMCPTWQAALEFFIKKEHYNNVDKIIKIKSNMNKNRTYFNWDHLQNFYIIED
jgi:hypothetical protein